MITHNQLKLTAALIWYTGGIVLALKAYSLILEALQLQPHSPVVVVSIIVGVIIGLLKARFIFNKSCYKNLERIHLLQQPKIWNAFRPRFFLFLVIMISIGATLSHQAHGSFNFLIAVATLDISISIALLWSSKVFW